MKNTVHPSPAPPGDFSGISKYNPHLWTPEQLRAIFVSRQRELAELTQTLCDLPTGTVGQHCLLVGARGMGKSTLIQRLALAVEDDASLSATWLPLRFPEEQYTVHTLAQFWANVLNSLSDALDRQGQADPAIDATATRLATLPPAEQAEAALQALRHISQTRGQRLLLLVDNTDLLLRNLATQAQWALRQVLLSEPQFLWVGTSCESLEANGQYHDAFLDFFRTTELRPLSLDEMSQALLALAHTFGGEASQKQMRHQLQAQPERLPTLRLLSGGNPRTTVMLYELLASGHAGHVRSDLEALLDNMTPLYKARLVALADLPRKLLAHILEHWAPMSLGQLAQASQIPKSSISPQLQRLEQEGLIEKTRLHGTTRSGYQAADRFFNIWYLMRLAPRRQRTRLGWLVEFMRMWFSVDHQVCNEEVETALDKNGPYPLANLARQLWGQNRLPEAKDLFSQAASLASHQHAHELQIQAHLCLNNQQLALQALDALAEQALQGSSMAYFRLCAQLWETHQLGQAERFADWAQQSTHALYLQPLIQALYILAGADAKLQDLPEEVRCASDAVVVKARRQLASYPNGQRLADACLPPAA